eukprot:TRINITY_DN8970_c0_g1_i2.p1 TRINITY_DN8970_c0_g1~~TRINITY_DN8970_c0_g1_i2.p1  ORF type:complete len:647 (-),score=168.70 TRINITY_DN8970_c0_g1_i2:36-1976(-)
MQSTYVKCRWEPEKWNPSRCRHCFLSKDKHDPKFIQNASNGQPVQNTSASASTPLQEVSAAPGSVSSTASRFGGAVGGTNAGRPLPPTGKSKSSFVPAAARGESTSSGAGRAATIQRNFSGSTGRGRGTLKKTATVARTHQVEPSAPSSSKSSFERSASANANSNAFPVKLRTTGLQPWREEGKNNNAAPSSSSASSYTPASTAASSYTSTPATAPPAASPPSSSIFPKFPALWGSKDSKDSESKESKAPKSPKSPKSPRSPRSKKPAEVPAGAAPPLPQKPSSSKSNFVRGATSQVTPPLPPKNQQSKPMADTSVVGDEVAPNGNWAPRQDKFEQERREQEEKERQLRLRREEEENQRYKPQFKKDAHYVELQYDYQAEGVKLYAKDILELRNWDDENWWFVIKDKIGFKGYVPSQYLLTIDNPANKINGVGNTTNAKTTTMAMANFDFSAQNKGEISCLSGDVLVILDSTNPNWWFLRHTKSGLTGFIPSNYLRVISNLPTNEPVRPVSQSPGSQIRKRVQAQANVKAYALWDYREASEGEISCKYGDLFTVVDQSDPNWWWVERDLTYSGGGTGAGGYLPSNYLAIVDQDTIDAYCEKKKQVGYQATAAPSNHYATTTTHTTNNEEVIATNEPSSLQANCIIS